MKTRILPVDEPEAVILAEQMLRSGSLVAFPTDTVYGLGAMAFNFQAIDQLYTVKGRDTSKAIAVLVGSISVLAQVTIESGMNAQRLVKSFWPGPLTLVMPRHPSLPPNLSPLPTIGVRMPDHKYALALLNRTGPLAVTSANLSGVPSAKSAEEVFVQLNGQIPLILNGGTTPGKVPSTVVDCTGDELIVLREGPISLAQLLAALS
jgi:L-threonylcarbamoyladenylate synthase